MSLKSKSLKRQEAGVRASQYTWENKRLGKGAQAEWESKQ